MGRSSGVSRKDRTVTQVSSHSTGKSQVAEINDQRFLRTIMKMLHFQLCKLKLAFCNFYIVMKVYMRYINVYHKIHIHVKSV